MHRCGHLWAVHDVRNEYRKRTGQYDHDIELELKQQQLEMKNVLKLRHLQLAAVDAQSARPMDEQLDLPLSMALDMLRDGDGQIALDVPVKGRLDDPGVGLNSIVSSAFGSALKRGSVGYLKYALQPYGAVFMAADYLVGQATAIQFEPVGSRL